MPHNVPFSELPASQPALIVIKEEDRSVDGSYEIGGTQIISFKFEIPAGGVIKINTRQFDEIRQSLSIRVWISLEPNTTQLFNHFHPGSGGIYHLFVDETIEPLPEPEVFQIQRNQYSGFSFSVGEERIPFSAGIYYYNVLNLEGHNNGFKINLVIPAIW